MALLSFIHSLNTNFGTSIFERIGIELRPEIDNYFKQYNK